MEMEARVKDWLTGLGLTDHAIQGELLNLSFGACSIFVFSRWRLVRHGPTIVGSASELPIREAAWSSLHGKRLTRIDVSAPWLDIELEFSGGEVFKTFQDSDQFENWNLRKNEFDGSYELMVAGPGADMALF